MDDATHDLTTEWNEDKLRAINVCRLYHGITYPSKLLLYNKTHINKEFLFGNSCMKSTKQIEGWPTQPLPLDSQWAVWRDFIYHKYTVNNSTTWKKDMIPTNIRRSNEESIEDQMQGLYLSLEPYQAMEYYIHHLPYKYQQFLQYWNDDHNNMFAFWTFAHIEIDNCSVNVHSVTKNQVK